MISCGEPSGDLYAGALTRELLRLDPSALITGFGSQRLRSAGATLVDDFQGLSVTGLLEVARVLPRTYAIYRRLLAHAAATRPDVFVGDRFSRLQFPARARHAQARRAGRLLHQPAVVGVAARPDEDDAAHRRSRAGHLSLRGRDLPTRRRSSRMGGTPAARRVGGRGRRARPFWEALASTPRSPSLRFSLEAGSTR